MSQTRNLTAKNLKVVFDYIEAMSENTEKEKRDKKIMEYAFVHDMSARKIAKLKDPEIVGYGQSNRGKPLTYSTISLIIKQICRENNLIREVVVKKSKNVVKRNRLKAEKDKETEGRRKVCAMCGAKEKIEMHHMIPLWAGGENSKYNIVPLCQFCHREATKIQNRDMKRIIEWQNDYEV